MRGDADIHRVYLITIPATGKRYVGITMLSLKTRLSMHVSSGKSPLSLDIAKHGKSSVQMVELFSTRSRDEASLYEAVEIRCRKTYAPFGYNVLIPPIRDFVILDQEARFVGSWEHKARVAFYEGGGFHPEPPMAAICRESHGPIIDCTDPKTRDLARRELRAATTPAEASDWTLKWARSLLVGLDVLHGTNIMGNAIRAEWRSIALPRGLRLDRRWRRERPELFSDAARPNDGDPASDVDEIGALIRAAAADLFALHPE